MKNIFGKENDVIVEELNKLIKDRSNFLANVKIKWFNQYSFQRYFAHTTCLWFYVEQTFNIKKEILKKNNSKYSYYHYDSIKYVIHRHLFCFWVIE